MSRLIVIEGADACGKETISRRLVERLVQVGNKAQRLAFPDYNRPPLGALITRHLRQEIAMMETPYVEAHPMIDSTANALVFQCMCAVQKLEASSEIIRSVIRRETVVCDRWWQSASVYGALDGIDPAWTRRVHSDLPVPDINILIDVSLEESRRRKPRPDDHYEAHSGRQLAVRAAYTQLWQERMADPKEPGLWYVVDGHGTRDEVFARVLRCLA